MCTDKNIYKMIAERFYSQRTTADALYVKPQNIILW